MSTYPEDMAPFLAKAGWADAVIEPLPGDASFRRYFRLRKADGTAMLMHAPPPEEDTGPFLQVSAWLTEYGHRAPAIYANDAAGGWILMEDFGDDRMRDWLDDHPAQETAIYQGAIDALVRLHASPPGPFDPYDLATYQRETGLFVEWYCRVAGLQVDGGAYHAAWAEVLTPLMARQNPGVTVLRDYHAENIMLLHGGSPHGGEQGLIDYQDALVGHPAYDLVSLLQDARREVTPELEQAMLEYYTGQVDAGPDFMADYARLGAQRNAKIVGIFTRLWHRDGKDRYLPMIPRVWRAMERDLAHPALGPVAQWFDRNIPRNLRDAHGGSFV